MKRPTPMQLPRRGSMKSMLHLPLKVSRPSGSRPRAGDHRRAPVPTGGTAPWASAGSGRVAVAVSQCSARRARLAGAN